jgi:hypothetical protein
MTPILHLAHGVRVVFTNSSATLRLVEIKIRHALNMSLMDVDKLIHPPN